VLYDGHCKFCKTQSRNLIALARHGAIESIDFQQPGILDRFPGVSYETCMEAMQLVTPDGLVYQGFEAVVRALATRPVFRRLPFVYYLPGIKHLCDWLYRFVAAHRYRLLGKAVAEGKCIGGTCSLHQTH
jgi:predicted DCC family thiol-disulfide oxidoreductase YuxK